MARHMRPKLITLETLRAVDREYRDLVMSLRALASLLHDPDPGAPDDRAWEPVLANILDAELNQLATLMGDVTAALRMEHSATGPRRSIDLSRALESAVRRTGSRVLTGLGEPVRVAAHPEIVSQAIMSAVSLALRTADGRVSAGTRRRDDEAGVAITVPMSEERHWNRLDARLSLLRRIVGAEGGRVAVDHRSDAMILNLWFPVAGKAKRSESA
ncbi:MAG TPA: hypothetical protein VGB64_00625 [Actinomycetota bacterium]